MRKLYKRISRSWFAVVRLLIPFIFLAGCENNTTDIGLDYGGFSRDDEGWLIVGNGIDSLPVYSPNGGNPGGYIYETDKVSGIWYFLAPVWLVNQIRESYGRQLSFELKIAATDNQYSTADIILVTEKGQLSLTTRNPGLEWTFYYIKLDESLPWKTSNGKAATQADFKQVVAGLKQVKIRGDYRPGPDRTSLDNVQIR